jgi:hypothetical protein
MTVLRARPAIVTRVRGSRRRPRLRAGLVLAAGALLLAACVSSPGEPDTGTSQPREPGMNHADAKQRILGFAAEALADAAPGRHPVPGTADGREEECFDGLRYDGTVLRTHEREIRDVDERLAATAEQRFTAFLQRKGLTADRDASTPGVVDLRASDDGILFFLSVNRNDHTLLAGGNTPCLPPT